MSKKKRLLFIAVGIALAVILAGAIFLFIHYQKIQKDFRSMENEVWDSLFLSMYPVDAYEEEDFYYYRGLQILPAEYSIPNGKVMRWYMKHAVECNEEISTVYLGIDPERTAKEDIVILIQENPQIRFEILIAHPKMDYWLDKSRTQCDKALETYQIFAEWVIGLPNAGTYFYGDEEWLVCNEGNYTDTFTTNKEVSLFLMCNSDYLHSYMLTQDNVAAEMQNMRNLIEKYRETGVAYPECGDYDIVFLGDSIIGNYTDSMSVPEVVKTLTGAGVYNCGYGGRSAALGKKDDLSMDMIAQAIIEEDIKGIPADTQVYAGLEAFFKREETDKKLMFVINYGLNDFFNGYPVQGSDAYDHYSYTGALRAGVTALKKAYPEAEILLMTPNFTVYYDYGEAVQSAKGGTLKEYAEAVISLGEELDVKVLDNFHELPINRDNFEEYLSDGCHLNERGRFLLGSRISEQIK